MLSNDMPASEIASRLSMRVEEVVSKLRLSGKRSGRELRVSGADSPVGSVILIVLSGPKQGRINTPNFTLYNGKNGGDLLHLIAAVERCSQAEAFAWAKDFLGIQGGRGIERRPETEEEERARKKRQAARDDEHRRDIQRRTETAKSIWQETTPIAGTAGEAYFSFRGVAPAAYQDGEIRFHPSLSHHTGHRGPAVVARAVNSEGQGRAVWRIWIARDGRGKANVDPQKMGLGPAEGCAVRIGNVARDVGLAEGVETAAAAREIMGLSIPVWSLLSTSGFQNFVPVQGVRKYRIFTDGDLDRWNKQTQKWEPPPGKRAGEILKRRLFEFGCDAEIEPPPNNGDWLDILKKMKEADER